MDTKNIFFLGLIALVSCIQLLLFTHIIPAQYYFVPLVCAFIPISISAIKKLFDRKIGTELFVTIATIIAFFAGQPYIMSVVLYIMLIAEYFEHIITARTETALKSLINVIPQKALIKLPDNTEQEIPVEKITPKTQVIIKTGGLIPVDGTVHWGTASVNESSLTGESILVEKKTGDSVFAGTFIVTGSIIITAEKIGAHTFFGKITALVQQAETKKARISLLADKISFYFVPSLLLFILITWLFTHNITIVTTLLVFGSPLELTLITPLAILSGIAAAFKNGILVKGGLVLEKLSQINTIVFDKTGTLTMGEPKIISIQVTDPAYTEQKILTIAAVAEKKADHAYAHAVLTKAAQENITVPDPEQYVSVTGHGVEIIFEKTKYFVGNKHFIEAPEHGNITIPPNKNISYDSPYSILYIGAQGLLCGTIYLNDTMRTEAASTINSLKNLGISRVILLTGDRQTVAQQVGSALGISDIRGELFPDEKLTIIEQLQKDRNIVAMVGDGINDAPALKQADAGIVMGAMGMEPAIDAADIVLTTNDLEKIVFVYGLSKKIFSTIYQNLLFGFLLIHGMGIVLTFFGFINPLRAALIHAVSDIGILLNSVRLINFKIK